MGAEVNRHSKKKTYFFLETLQRTNFCSFTKIKEMNCLMVLLLEMKRGSLIRTPRQNVADTMAGFISS